jgi:ABC-2 type transport system permease protein
MHQLWAVYRKLITTSVAVMLQYRLMNIAWLLSMVFEPIVYLAIWGTLATQQGGAIVGYSGASLAGYYVAWTLVRQWNIALTPFGFEQRVREGQLTPLLLRPLHPFHYDLADFIALRFVGTLYWLPVGVALVLIFQPQFSTDWRMGVLFFVSLVLSFIMRFVLVYALGLVTFWTTRVSAVFNLYFAVEAIISGRLVPHALLPAWVQPIALVLPFRWSFGFPIEIIIGKLSITEVFIGFAVQLAWLAVSTLLFVVLWRAGVKKYSAVGA